MRNSFIIVSVSDIAGGIFSVGKLVVVLSFYTSSTYALLRYIEAFILILNLVCTKMQINYKKIHFRPKRLTFIFREP